MEAVRLDLGGGADPVEDHLNIDLRVTESVDIVASADNLPFKDGTVKRIHANSLVPHLPDLNRAIEEWSRALEPGGELELAATHAHSTGIVADPDHSLWSWTSQTPEWYDADSKWNYFHNTELELIDVSVVGWLRPYRWWLRPFSYLYGKLIHISKHDIADELMKFPFAGGRVRARWRKHK
ncbi:methyltransferase domain-containing protein [Natronosalvus rutilus]|uniref:Class I SAM-dependent methyltransferase n=1 Tax=Natronosalvus rutilus TaxID=2953753 RepID=A0A9E7SUN3_9EURY|nr:methyltransferase domain-containing protein [Natronosalvus rutilus]UTF54984.1 class I SAM-dependent methyltransferase [Natronosalvus rutilus]